jgi:fumarylacetoacetase
MVNCEPNYPAHTSWAPVEAGSDFPIPNLPLGVFATKNGEPRLATRTGEQVLDLRELARLGYLDGLDIPTAPVLNPLLERGREYGRALRTRLSWLWNAANGELRDEGAHVSRVMRGIEGVEILLPHGQTRQDQTTPAFGPSRRHDIELETAFVVGKGSKMGEPVGIAQAEEHLAGTVLLNDWPARDIQRWEYQPLGPFLGKSFATSITPRVVSMDALEPFRVAGPGNHDIHLIGFGELKAAVLAA